MSNDKEEALSELKALKILIDEEFHLVENNWKSEARKFSVHVVGYDVLEKIHEKLDWAIRHVNDIEENEDE